MIKKLFFTFFAGLLALHVSAQRITARQYIEMYKDIAISEMKRTGVPADITLAQGILESEYGNSELVRKSNNHFGIKCKSSWKGATVYHDDDLQGECFRAYETSALSYRDHSDFLLNNSRYKFLFSLDVADYKGWAKGLTNAGYATNPQYFQVLISNIELYNLQQYTQQALQGIPATDSSRADAKAVSLPLIKQEVVLIKEDETAVQDMVPVSEKYFLINRSKCLSAKKGTSLLAIATRNGINLSKLLEFNDMAKDGLLKEDQYVFLEKKSKTGETEYYTVRPGETLYSIAQKNGITLQSLFNYNTIGIGDKLEPGTKLLLKPGSAVAAGK